VRNAGWDDPNYSPGGEPVPLHVLQIRTEAVIERLETYFSMTARGLEIPVDMLNGNIEAWRTALSAI
jgi:hypothetical protein